MFLFVSGGFKNNTLCIMCKAGQELQSTYLHSAVNSGRCILFLVIIKYKMLLFS